MRGRVRERGEHAFPSTKQLQTRLLAWASQLAQRWWQLHARPELPLLGALRAHTELSPSCGCGSFLLPLCRVSRDRGQVQQA